MFEGYYRRYRFYSKFIGVLAICCLILTLSSDNSSFKRFIRRLANKKISTNVIQSIEFLHSSYTNLDYQCETVIPIIVISKASNVERREAIRRTWASETFFRNQTIQLKVFFLVGTDDFNIKRIYAEQILFNDIIHVSLPEMNSFTAYKEVSAMIWIRKYLPKAKFYIKTEDFTIINTRFMFEKMFPLIEKLADENYIIGWFGSEHIIQRGRYQKFIDAVFPRSLVNQHHHAMGLLYIITSSAADQMLHILGSVELIDSPGDPFLTGILRNTAHIKNQNLAALKSDYQYMIAGEMCSVEFQKNKQLLLCSSNQYQHSTHTIWDYFDAWNSISD